MTLTPIPLPADDYDRIHSTHAALSSLHAATTSFDAAMDSLVQTVDQQHRRVRLLEKRAQRCREWIGKLNDLVESKSNTDNKGEDYRVDDAICTVFSPGTYEEALQGIQMEIEEVKGDLSTQQTASSSSSSASDATRKAANDAVKQALIRDANTDDGEAMPSDLWLDLASVGVNLGRSIKATDTQRHVPLLLGALNGSTSGNCMEEREYGAILDSLVSSSSTSMNPTAMSNTRLSYSHTPGDDESVISTTSKMSALTMTSTAMSTSGRLTAGQRRRWHQQQQQMRNIKAGVATTKQPSEKTESQTLSETKAVNNSSSEATPSSKSPPNAHNYLSNNISTRGRQQAVSGSQPYLCEVLHDSFGIGTEPKKGLVDCNGFSGRGNREGGSEFHPPLSSIDDLTIFNTTTRESYGLAKRR
eukprot:CAMPEP_0201725546 /NCGR_PEP_ID=MMETSP0593-20130828/8912_1 /ASSEMBLY_ACC=CAM_ASM_000672 /TAXON_ID=267983 /ORGANISM="Skeletonema japonicum, Strain CCMP2506" /LENGTH=415 /DNA_ID=CAMNT_0048216955 /DNA_START=105 /DNA_END=1349 /DNA_ORIENTATION=+